MKKQSFTLLIAVLFLVQGIAQQVEQQQRSLLTKRTADWCPYCGTWGWNFFKDAIEDNGNKAIYIAAHYDGGLSIEAATDITENLGGGYQPRFFLNDADQGVSSGNASAKLTSLKEAIDENFNLAPIANCGFEPLFENGKIKVGAKVKFFQAAEGEYYLGVYLLENNVTAYQASIGNNAVHPKLLIASFTTGSFGQLITDGSIAAGQEFELDFSHDEASITGRDFEVIGIIWKKEGDKYVPINVWGTDDISTEQVSGIADKLPENKMVVAPNVVSEHAIVAIELINELPEANLSLYDLQGRQVASLYKGHLKAGYQTVNVNISGASGTYFIRLNGKGLELIEKVVVR